MPAIQYSYQSDDPQTSPARLLSLAGPSLAIDIGAPSLSGASPPPVPAKAVAALIDTGLASTCIDDNLAQELGLKVIDRRPVRGPDKEKMVNVYLARVVVHATRRESLASFVGLELGANWPIVLGRDFLADIVMTYDGVNGIVTISG